MKYLIYKAVVTASLLYIVTPVNALPRSKANGNATLSDGGSHFLITIENAGRESKGAKRNSRCTPCGPSVDDRREVTNNLDPEYRGNGADNLGYDWSPMAWGGPAFSRRSRIMGGRNPMDIWDRSRGGRQMPGNWDQGADRGVAPRPLPPDMDRFSCDRCRMFWERERESRRNQFGNRNNFSNRMGQWQDDYLGYNGDVTTVTSPTITLRPEGRITYVPSPGGEMFWDGVSGGGTRWDGFSNGISWLGGGNRQWNDQRSRYDQGSIRRPSDSRDGSEYEKQRPNESRIPYWYGSGPGYDRGLITNDMRERGYASKWQYGMTNQNGWNGNNMKWNYGGKDWSNRDGYGHEGDGSQRGKYNEEGNPLPYGPGVVQYGQGGSLYYDQGNYIFYYGQGGFSNPYGSQDRFPQDGKPTSTGSEYPNRPRPDNGQRPWNYNPNDRYDNHYPSNNWIRPGTSESGYPKPANHGKYPSGGTDDKTRDPWPQRPILGGYGRPNPGSGLPGNYPTRGHGGPDSGSRRPGEYSTGDGSYGGHGRPDSGSGRPGEYPSGSDSSGRYGNNRPGGFAGNFGSHYPGGNQGGSGSSGYLRPSHGSNTGYTSGPGADGKYPEKNRPAGSYNRPGNIGYKERPNQFGGGSNFIPPTYPLFKPQTGYYTGFITEIDSSNRYPGPSGANSGLGGQGGNPYPYPGGVRDSRPGYGAAPWNGNTDRYPAGGDRYPSGVSNGAGYSGGSGSRYPSWGSGDRYPLGGGGNHDKYPSSGGDRYPTGGGDRYPSGGGRYPAGAIGSGDGGDGRYPTRGDGGGRYPTGGGMDRYPMGGYGNRYPTGGGSGNRYPTGGGGDRYPSGEGGGYYINSNAAYPSGDKNQYYGSDSDRYSGFDRGDYQSSKPPYQGNTGGKYPTIVSGGDSDKGPNDGQEHSWNYGQESHKEGGIYRRAGGSYPPYRGGQYYTSSYLASASTPAASNQSEGKTQSVTKADDITQTTPASA